jgi:hypothetical protein
MAKRNYRKSTKKIQPAVMTMQFNLTNNKDATYAFDTIDLSKCASALNRRFYRQGIQWAVAGFTFLSTSQGNITIQKLPNTWMASNAWEKTFRSWNKQQIEAAEEAGALSAEAKYRDFKILMDSNHLSNVQFDGDGVPIGVNDLSPIDISGAAVNGGEWQPSQIVIPNFGAPGVNYEPLLIMVGDDVGGAGGAKGMIKGYQNSRAYPQSPDPVSPDIGSNVNWFQSMFDVGDNNEDIMDNVTDKNDNLPYDQVDYPGGDNNFAYLETVDESYITGTTVGGKTHMTGSSFPCGLIRIRNQSNDSGGWASEVKCFVHLVPGDHRGYLCEPMQDM